ncbi:MAG: 4-(cytidine 5'-diphospho)-2-C-methyl-D-erythritol kinase [Alphaproteobacteria bacterium]|nr:4-(cytidine 5'-diphospho)-2-C-methyl-D-erythritol kinase [Alphaproteobacteria bacterium]
MSPAADILEPGTKVRTWLAPAKINLALHVTGRRADGYHLIDSLAVFTRFGDRLDIEPAEQDEFSVSGRYAAGLPLDDGNLVVKARDALRREAGAHRTPPVAIRLQKNLPIPPGVGGGPSDAAAAPHGSLARIGLALGADLPMCLKSKPLVARGIGDEVSPLSAFPALGLVLVNPGVAVSTPDVFRALSSRDNEALPPLPRRLDFHAIRNWLGTTRNDLEPAAQAIQPAVGEALKALKRADAAFARMSGSGATCFGLFETGNVAKRAAIEIRARHPDWFVAATRSMEVSDGEA